MTTIIGQFKKLLGSKINCETPEFFVYLYEETLNVDLRIIYDGEEVVLKYKYIGRSTLELNTRNISEKFKHIPRIFELVVLYQECDKDTGLLINKYVLCFIIFDHPINKWNTFLLKNDTIIVTGHTNVFSVNKEAKLNFNNESISKLK